MAAPTERLTARTQQILGEDVVLAVRVNLRPPGRLSLRLGRLRSALSFAAIVVPVGSAIVLTFLGAARLLSRRRTGSTEEPVNGVLAILRNGERVLLRASDFRPSRPIEAIQRFPKATPLEPDVDLMEKHMIAQLTLDGQAFVVNGVDFNQVLKRLPTAQFPPSPLPPGSRNSDRPLLDGLPRSRKSSSASERAMRRSESRAQRSVNSQSFGKGGQRFGSAWGNHEQVLDAHPAHALDIGAGFHGECHTHFGCGFGSR